MGPLSGLTVGGCLAGGVESEDRGVTANCRHKWLGLCYRVVNEPAWNNTITVKTNISRTHVLGICLGIVADWEC